MNIKNIITILSLLACACMPIIGMNEEKIKVMTKHKNDIVLLQKLHNQQKKYNEQKRSETKDTMSSDYLEKIDNFFNMSLEKPDLIKVVSDEILITEKQIKPHADWLNLYFKERKSAHLKKFLIAIPVFILDIGLTILLKNIFSKINQNNWPYDSVSIKSKNPFLVLIQYAVANLSLKGGYIFFALMAPLSKVESISPTLYQYLYQFLFLSICSPMYQIFTTLDLLSSRHLNLRDYNKYGSCLIIDKYNYKREEALDSFENFSQKKEILEKIKSTLNNL